MKSKKIIAGLLALTFVFGGTVSNCAPVISQCITAQAAREVCYTFDENTGVLTLKGEVDRDTIINNLWYIRGKFKSIVAENGTVLPENCRGLFEQFDSCTSIDLSNADTSKVTSMEKMFFNCSNLTTLDVSGFDTSSVTDMNDMFANCCNLTKLDVSGFDTRNVTDMSGMFDRCTVLSSLDVSGFDTSKVTRITSMFWNCRSLTALDVSRFDTSNVDSMYRMFFGCSSLNELDVSGFDTSNVKSMESMFCGCSNLNKLDVSGFDTSNVTGMRCMFFGCSNLKTLDVSKFDTSNVTDMVGVFATCSNLKTLDLSSFDTSSVTDMYDIFAGCEKLNTLTLSENFKNIKEDAVLPNGDGWVNINDPKTVISGDGEYAVIYNNGKNTYKLFGTVKPTYPTNIKVECNEKTHQVRFTWDKVEGADRYGIAVYMAGKWRIQKQDITTTSYTTPKNLTPGKTYKVAIAAKVDGSWDTANAIKNAVTVTVDVNLY